MGNNCKHLDKSRVNDTLKQCTSCGKLFTVKPLMHAPQQYVTKDGRQARVFADDPEAPEGYERASILADRYGINRTSICRWVAKGLVSKYGRHWYYEKDVKSCVDHIGEHSSELKRTGLVSTRVSHRVHHPSLSRNDQKSY